MHRAALVLLLLACGCTPEPALPPEGPHPPYWTVDAGGKSSLLLGTMHAEADVGVLAPAVFEALHSARTLVTEADVRSIDQQDFLQRLVLPAGTTLSGAVSAEDFERIRRALAGVVDIEVADGLQPWFLEGQIVGTRLPQDIDPIDAALVRDASAAGVPLAFFETWQDQVTALNALGFADGLSVLLATARDPDAAVDAHLQWAAAYSAGDVEEMTALAFDPAAMAARPAFYDTIVDRHRAWIDEVRRQVDAGDAVIAIGFMHMLTPRGLPTLLEDAGYAVTLHADAPSSDR